MSDLESAAQRLRDSVAALRSHERSEWRPGTGHVYTANRGWWLANGLNAELAQHIALAASPPTLLLLANLLDAIRLAPQYGHDLPQTLTDRADALASAILHTDQRDSEGEVRMSGQPGDGCDDPREPYLGDLIVTGLARALGPEET